jgi:hypothetical protein
MSIWIPVSFFALFFAFIAVRAVRVGRKERAYLERVFTDLGSRRCPACMRAYGPQQPDYPYATFIPDPDFEDSTYQTFWKIRCAACDYAMIAGLAADAEVLVMLRPAATQEPAGTGEG